MVNTSHES